MVSWRDYEMKQEQVRDHLREAEKQRLIRQATSAYGRRAIRESVKSLVMGRARRGPARYKVACGGQTCLVEKVT